MNLPFVDNKFDYSISIAVLHHLASVEHRLKLMSECIRIVKPKGQIFFCAWALEQEDKSRRVFSQQDMMVPWQLQERFGDNNVYLRYCHLYKKGELEELVFTIPGVEVIDSFYDSSNWCVTIKKL